MCPLSVEGTPALEVAVLLMREWVRKPLNATNKNEHLGTNWRKPS
jgi:hypothetical protein